MWDIDNDGATHANVSFAETDIASAVVTDSTHLTITLTGAKGAALEATSGYGGAATDTLQISAGFGKDLAGNVATTDARANGALSVPTPVAGQAVIDLGYGNGRLIAPVKVEGAWYYKWDLSGDGTGANTDGTGGNGSGLDSVTHDVLDGLFTQDINGVTGGAGNTTNTYRYATINGVHLALPTSNGLGTNGLNNPLVDTGVNGYYPQGIGNNQPSTSYTDAVSSNGTTSSTFSELLAIWDAYNGTDVGSTSITGMPSGWEYTRYWSATPSALGRHASVDLVTGKVEDTYDTYGYSYYAALQVL